MNEITTASPTKPALQFGILFGVIMILEFIVGYVMNIDPATNRTYGIILNVLNYFILPIIFISMACTSFKNMNGGFATFGQCLKIGVIICVIAALIYTIFFAIFVMIFPEFVPDMMEKVRSITIEQNPDMTQDQLDMSLSIMEKFMNPVILIPATTAMFAFMGLIYSLIIGAIVKKERPVGY